MKEVKFRAWHKLELVMGTVKVFTIGEGCFVEGVEQGHVSHPYDRDTGEVEKSIAILPAESGRFCRLETLELMQYTGLKDKNGVDIYEGDIVEYDDGKVTEIRYRNAFFYASSKLSARFMLTSKASIRKIIGNIYETPELLK